jgi:hypothetical protein
MPLYNCEYCYYSTKNKQHFSKHKNTKKHRNKLIELGLYPEEQPHNIQNNPALIQNNPKIIQKHPVKIQKHPVIIPNNPVTQIYKCDFCPKTFTNHSNKRRHEMYRCKENPEFLDKIINDKNNRIKNLQKDKETLEKDKETLEKDKEKLESEKKELYRQVSTLLDKVGDTNIQNNIILNSYGKEDLSHITDALKTELLSIPYGAIPKMIEAIHFNDEKPENKNIVIPNKKENLVKIFEGDKWIYKNKNDTITDLVDSKYNIIDEHYFEMDNAEKVNPQIKTSFTKFRKFYEDGDEEMVADLKKQCELVLLNNR